MTLAEWFKTDDGSKRSKAEFAAKIGVTPQMISAYLNGTIWPSKERMRLIEENTNGAVTANDFVHAEAAQ